MTLRATRRFQVGPEGTPGTAVAATEPLLGVLTWDDKKELYEPDEDRNSLARHIGGDDEFVNALMELTWTGAMNHRHIIYPIVMGVRGNITPTQPDSTNQPNAYLYTVAPSLTAANTPDQTNGVDTFTFEFGDETQADEAEFCFATQIQLQGSVGGVWEQTITISGRQKTDCSFTGALSYSSVQRFPFNKTTFAINTSGATLGDTQKTGLLTGVTWTLDTMLRPFFAADGNLYFSSVAEDKKVVELQLTYKKGTDSEAERAKFDANTVTFLRIKAQGQTVLDSGQSNPPYVQLDQAIEYTSWPMDGAQDGLSTVQVTAKSVYDATWAKMFEVAILTDLAAIPT